MNDHVAAPSGQPPARPVPQPLLAWRSAADARDPAQFDDLLADDAEFRSPAVFTPQRGKPAASVYLTAAVAVLGPSLRYLHEWYDNDSAALEFEADLDGMYVQGIDLVAWNAAGKLTSVTVLVRPLRGLEKLIELMGAQLADLQG